MITCAPSYLDLLNMEVLSRPAPLATINKLEQSVLQKPLCQHNECTVASEVTDPPCPNPITVPIMLPGFYRLGVAAF